MDTRLLASLLLPSSFARPTPSLRRRVASAKRKLAIAAIAAGEVKGRTRIPRRGGHEQAARPGKSRDERDGRPAAERVGDEAREQRPENEAAVAPEAVD